MGGAVSLSIGVGVLTCLATPTPVTITIGTLLILAGLVSGGTGITAQCVAAAEAGERTPFFPYAMQ